MGRRRPRGLPPAAYPGGLRGEGPAAIDDLAAIDRRFATSDVTADRFAPLIAAQPPGPVRDALLQWASRGAPILDRDGDGRVDDPAVAAYEAFLTSLTSVTLGDEMGPFLETLRFPDETSGSDDHSRGFGHTSVLYRALTGRTRHDFAAQDGFGGEAAAREAVRKALAEAEGALKEGRVMPRHVFPSVGTGISAPAIDRLNLGNFVQIVEVTDPPAGAA